MRTVRLSVTATAMTLLLGASGSASAAGTTGYVSGGDAFYHLDSTSLTLSPTGTVTPLISTATASDRTLYGVVEDGRHLVTINPATGATTPVGQLALPASYVVSALTAAADGTVYAATYDSSSIGVVSRLFRVDPATADTTAIGEARSGDALVALAGACGGRLLGVDFDNNLVRVNRSSGAPRVVGPLGPGLGGDDSVSLAYDHATRSLWALASASGGRLYKVDDVTGRLTSTPFASGQLEAPMSLAFDGPSACRYSRTLTLSYSTAKHRFQGRLAGEYAPCAEHQVVRVFQKQPGPDKLMGVTTTSASGSFRLSQRLVKRAYAVAPRSSSTTTGVCLAVRT